MTLPDGSAGESRRIRTLVLLMTDIEGSTPLWDHSAPIMEVALPRHDSIVTNVVTEHGGHLVRTKGEGDSTFSVFDRVEDAVSAAMQIQTFLSEEHWPGGIDLRVRMGIHMGEAIARGGDYFGTTVNRAARLRGLAHGGEIVVSKAVSEAVGIALPNIQLTDIGSFMLRGLSAPELVQRIVLDGTTQLTESPSNVTPPPFPTSLMLGDVFVGRDSELEALLGMWRVARDRGESTVLVTGEGGSGKSRLVAEAAAIAYGEGACVVHALGEGAESPTPFLAITAALTPLIRHWGVAPLADIEPIHLARVTMVLPIVGEELSSLPFVESYDLQTDRDLVIDSVIEVVAALANRLPLILVLDDLQDASSTTQEFLRRLAAAQVKGLCIVGTVAMLVDGEGTSQSVLPGEVIALPRLPRKAAVELIEALSRRGPDLPTSDDQFVDALLNATGGNPLLIRETLQHLSLSPVGAFALRPDSAILASLPEIVGKQLTGLGGPVRRVLECAALVGLEFSVSTLERIEGIFEQAPTDVVHLLDQAVTAGIVLEQGAGSYGFSHDLVRAAILIGVDPELRATLHLQIANALESNLVPMSPGTLAMHFDHGLPAVSNPDEKGKVALLIAEYAYAAATQALDRFGFEEAVAHLTRAVHTRNQRTLLEPIDAKVSLVLAQALRAAQDVDGARRAGNEAADIALQLADRDLVTATVVELAEHGTVGMPDEDTRTFAIRGLALIGPEWPAQRSLLLSALAFHDMVYAGDRSSAASLVAEATVLARLSGDDRALANALSVTGAIELSSPDQEAQLDRGRELRSIGARLGDATLTQRALRIEACGQLQLGNRQLFGAALTRLVNLAEKQKSWFWRSLAIQWQVMDRLMDGRLEEAEQLANELLTGAGNDVDLFNVYGAELMILREEQGRIAEILPLAAAGVEQNPGLVAFRVALAAGYAELGDHQESRRFFAPLAANQLAAIPDDVSRVGALALLAQAASIVGNDEECDALDAGLAPYRGQLVVLAAGIACLGAADRYRGQLAARRGDWEIALGLLRDAEALEQQVTAKALLTRTRLSLAQALINSGLNRSEGLLLAEQVRRSATDMGMLGVAAAAELLCQ
jgi:class 3 adenylate cyclase/tetratricopeptide (TPR) repeat protein